MRTILRNTFLAGAVFAFLPGWVGRARAEEEPLDLAQLAAILDYVVGDYGSAVQGGQVVNPGELAEQQGFLEQAIELAEQLEPVERPRVLSVLRPALAAARRGDPAEQVVPSVARVLAELKATHGLNPVPKVPPSIDNGRRLFGQGCEGCHGIDGSSRTELALELSTKAPDLRTLSPSHADPAVLQRIYGAVSFGVPGTAMPSYREAWSESERWDVSAYVASLDHRAASGGTAASAAGLRRAVSAVARVAEGYGAGDRDGARRQILSAYLDEFEPFEGRLRVRDAAGVTEIEGLFRELTAAVAEGAPVDQVQSIASRLELRLEKAEAATSGGTAWLAFGSALIIALREGLEAVLLLGALLALATRAGHSGSRRAVHGGWAAAGVVGAATWWLSGAMLAHAGLRRELTEGIVQLVTAALLLAGSHWLLARATARRIGAFLSERARGASFSQFGFFGLAFLAVYRELFEVVVFFRGLLLESPGEGTWVLAGAAAGLVVLAGVALISDRLGRALRPRVLLLSCGLLLCGLSVVMVGEGVRALQEAGVVGMRLIPIREIPALGVFPTLQGVGAQATVLLGLLGSWWYTAARHRDQPAQRPPSKAVTGMG
jgi:high-affinity iron transporter